MDLRVIPRTVIDQSIRVARLPLDIAIDWIEGPDPVGPAHIAVDRTDASARELLGRITGDDHLVSEAARRRAAANKRGEALRLRNQAARDEVEAVEALDSGRKKAEALRNQAEKTAEAREEAAERAAEEELRKVEEQGRRQRAAVRNAEKIGNEQRRKQERRAKLEALEEEESALAEKQDALTTREEAERLEEAAASVKAERKAR